MYIHAPSTAIAISSFIVSLASIVIAIDSSLATRRLNRAKFLYDLHQDFFSADTYKFILDALDEPPDHDGIVSLVQKQDSRLVALLNAFELVAYFVKTGQLTNQDANALLDYYFDCILRHNLLTKYINDKSNSFEHLSALLHKRL